MIWPFATHKPAFRLASCCFFIAYPYRSCSSYTGPDVSTPCQHRPHFWYATSKGNNRKALVLQERCCIWNILGVKLRVSLEQLPDVQVTIFAELPQLGLSHLALHSVNKVSSCASLPYAPAKANHTLLRRALL